MAQVETNTDRYEFAHGKKPRGYGYWAFAVTVEVVERGFTALSTEEDPHFEAGNFGDARRAAVAWAKQEVKATLGGTLGCVAVEVLS